MDSAAVERSSDRAPQASAANPVSTVSPPARGGAHAPAASASSSQSSGTGDTSRSALAWADLLRKPSDDEPQDLANATAPDPLAVESTFVDPGQAADVATFVRALSAPPPAAAISSAWMGPLADGLCEQIEAGRTIPGAPCEFELDVPGLGTLSGRVSIHRGQADVELRAARPATAAALRARHAQLQSMVDRESGGDVNLFLL